MIKRMTRMTTSLIAVRAVLVCLLLLTPVLASVPSVKAQAHQQIAMASNAATGFTATDAAMTAYLEGGALAEPLPFSNDDPHKQVYVAFSSSARTATANSSAIDVGDADKLILILSVTAHSGTNPTLDVKAQDTPDNGTTYSDIASGAMTQVTTTDSVTRLAITSAFARKIRIVATIGGTTPSYTFACWVVVIKTASA